MRPHAGSIPAKAPHARPTPPTPPTGILENPERQMQDGLSEVEASQDQGGGRASWL